MKFFYVQTSSPPYPFKGRRYNSMGTRKPDCERMSPSMVDLRRVYAENGRDAIREVKLGNGVIVSCT